MSNRLGKGQTVYVAFSPEAAYLGNYPLAEHRLLVRNLIRSLISTLPVTVEAPLNVETVITHDKPKRRYIVHFVSYSGLRDGNAQTNPGVQILGRSKLRPSVPFMEESQIYKARITLGSEFKTALTVVAGSRVTRQGLQSQEVHDAVVINY